MGGRQMAMQEFRKKFTWSYLADIKNILDSMEADLFIQIDKVASILTRARENRNTIFTMGNGGSAATASHFVIDLSKMTIIEGSPRFKAVGLNDNIPSMLAWANDASYEDIFVEQLKNLMEPRDVVIGISGSGNSMNVINAIEYANSHGAITIGLSGYDGGKLLKCAQENIHVPSDNIQRVEDVHLIIEHLLNSLLRDEKVKKVLS
jgi:D-sedoheptulose 7-phosphate isomerase